MGSIGNQAVRRPSLAAALCFLLSVSLASAAWTHIGNAGHANLRSSGTTLAITASATVEAGNVAVLYVSSDNLKTTDGDCAHITVTDTSGNRWIRVKEATNGQGGADLGADVGIFYTLVATQITASTSTITVTWTAAVTAKAATVHEFTIGAGDVVTVTRVDSLFTDGVEPASKTISGLVSREYLWLDALAAEGSIGDTACSANASHNLVTRDGTVVDPNLSPNGHQHSTICGMYRISTATTDTMNMTSDSRDYAEAYAVLRESTPPQSARCFTIAPVIYHVNNGVACNDLNVGSVGSPLCTVQAGVNKLANAGDSVYVHQGTYAECVSLTNPGTDGTATSPITIRGAPGEDPTLIIIDPNSLNDTTCTEPAHGACANNGYGFRAALTIKGTGGNKLSFIRVQDLTLRPPTFEDPAQTGCGGVTGCDHNYALDLQCTSDIEVLGIISDFQPAYANTASGVEASSDAIIDIYNSHRVLVKGAKISRGGVIAPGFHAIAAWGASTDYWLTESSIADLDGGTFAQSQGNKGITLTFSDVNNMNDGADGGNNIQAYNIDNLRIAYNRVRGHKFSVTSIRSYDPNTSTQFPRVAVTNNYFKTGGSNQTAVLVGSSAVNDAVRYVSVRDNLFEGYLNGIRLTNNRILNCNLSEKNNGYWNVGTPVQDNDPNCIYAINANSLVLGVDPLDPNDRPNGGAAIIDVGDPLASVPTGGGSIVDMGGAEAGNARAWTAAYAFQSIDTTSDTTPRIDWSGAADSSINIKDLDFKPMLLGVAQTKLQVQIDSIYTFNSLGISKPIFDSGEIVSANEFYDVTKTLSAGTYYGRVRLYSNEQGIWSAIFVFTVT